MAKLGTLVQIGRTFGLRNGFRRLEYEMQRASGLLSRRMRQVQGWEYWDIERTAPESSAENLLSTRRQGAIPFFFRDIHDIVPGLQKTLDAAAQERAIAEANSVLDGTLPYFGRLSFQCGFPPNWFRNPITGQHASPERSWTEMRFASGPSSDEYGDLKFILEPSRFLFVYRLARAYALTGDERFPEGFWRAIESWARSSPPMSGPLWICGQESSLRILSWSFALYAFLHSPSTTPSRLALLLGMVAAHAWRTTQTVGYARSQRSNHLFTEGVGLWTAGILYPELMGSSTWQKQGMGLIQEAVVNQVTAEGVLLQDSFNYQRMVLQLLIWTLRLADIHDIELSPEIQARTRAGLQFIGQFVDPISGSAPNHGSNDGSHILPLDTCEFGDYRPLLCLGNSILPNLAVLPPGPWDEAALWLGAAPLKSMESPSECSLTSAPGYYRVGTGNSWAFIRAGHYRRRPFQADQLHVDLWWHGVNLARDPGTYLYNGEPPWNNGFAGTAVHNTIMVDRRDQMRRAGRFLWVDWAQARVKISSDGKNSFPDCFEGEHNGFRRLGIKHRRTVRCVNENAWVIVDDLEGHGEHELQLHWLLPDLPFKVISESPFCAALSFDKISFRCNIFSSSPGTTGLARGAEDIGAHILCADRELLGWESPTYAELRPALSLLHLVKASCPVRIATVFLAGESVQLRENNGCLVLTENEVQLYQLSLKHH